MIISKLKIGKRITSKIIAIGNLDSITKLTDKKVLSIQTPAGIFKVELTKKEILLLAY